MVAVTAGENGGHEIFPNPVPCLQYEQLAAPIELEYVFSGQRLQ